MASMQPPSASSSPRFCNTGSFMRMPRMDDPTGMDLLVERTGLTAAELSSMLLVMELDGRVAVEHGRYSRKT